ncbi:LADA_0D08548g1_1 [Lachancea dasiensis]|uniref:LADA_0D08548g1_1 n=1 Tax=Lachancea dasiensis TaxID=1072105 RepID=A0A1G4J6W3_9SACH|nr:LADA_0D08548g1_1 [Lachancea dasiensis]
MSLPLRHPLDTSASLDKVLEDLIVRFIINCPAEDFSSVERELFHVEEATWFYTDFVKILNPNLPNLKIKSFAQHVIKLCPMVWKWDVRAEQALQKFSQYKRSIPVRGAAIFNKKLTKLLLVKGTESESWSFPRGKISKDENDVNCCVREVLEETGFDITDYIDAEQFIERNIGGKNYKIFIVSGVPEDFKFEPRVRNEIDKIQWHDFKKLSRNTNPKNSSVKIYLVNNLMRPLAMWVKSNRQMDDDEKLKAHVETQLKLLLGIKKEDTPDPGRELLNMLQSTVSAGGGPSQTPNLTVDSRERENATPGVSNSPPAAIPAPTYIAPPPQIQQSFPFMAFQPFAPFPFMNGTGIQIGASPIPESSSSSPENVQPPPTPKISTLAKPTVVEEDEIREFNARSEGSYEPQPASSRQLLDLLNKKPKASTNGAAQQNLDALKHDTILPSVASNSETDSKALLDLLKKPQKPITSDAQTLLGMIKKPSNADVRMAASSHLAAKPEGSSLGTDESEYEDFESSSESESEDSVEDPLESFSERYEMSNRDQRQRKNTDLLDENNTYQSNSTRSYEISTPRMSTGAPPAGSPYVGNISDAKGTHHYSQSSNNERATPEFPGADSSLKKQQKPKFKILKRGEILGSPNSTSSANDQSSPRAPQEQSMELLNLLRKSSISSPVGGNLPNESFANTSPHPSNEDGKVEKQAPTGEAESQSLLDLLKRGKLPSR